MYVHAVLNSFKLSCAIKIVSNFCVLLDLMTERSLRSFLSQLNSLLFCAVCCFVLNKHDYDYDYVCNLSLPR